MKTTTGLRQSETAAIHQGISLPPRVQGPVRFHLRVRLERIVWKDVPKQQPLVQPTVCWKWWGQDKAEQGIRLSFPSATTATATATSPPKTFVDNRKAQCSFPIQCAHKQLRAYLQDLGVASLAVVDGDRPMGVLFLPDLLSLVAPSPAGKPRTIPGTYAIMVPPSGANTITPWIVSGRTTSMPSGWKKLADCQITLSLEPVSMKTSASATIEPPLESPTLSSDPSPRPLHPDESFQSVRYKNTQPAEPAANQSWEQDMRPMVPPKPSAPPLPILPQSEITLYSLPGSPQKFPFQTPTTTNLAAKKTSPEKKVAFEGAEKEGVHAKAAVKTPLKPPKDKLRSIYERAKQLQEKMKRSLRETEDLSMMKEPFVDSIADENDAKQANVGRMSGNISFSDELDDDELVLQALNSKVATDLLSKELDESYLDQPMDDELISMDSDMISRLDDFDAPIRLLGHDRSTRLLPSLARKETPAPLLLQLGRVDAVRVDLLEINLTSDSSLEAQLLLPNEQGHLVDIPVPAQSKFVPSVVVPISFDEPLIQKWMDEHTIVRLLPQENKTWSAVAGFACSKVLSMPDLVWEGRLPLWKTTADEPVLDRDAFRRLADRNTTEILGNIKVRVELAAQRRAPSPVHGGQKVSLASPRLSLTPATATYPPAPAQKPIHFYLFTHVSSARKVSLARISGHRISVYLSTKYASLTGTSLETLPVDYDSEIMDMDFHYSAPFSMTPVALEKLEFLILEVWAVFEPTVIPLDFSDHEHDPSSFAKKHMVGLVKLPLSFLSRGIANHLDMQSTVPLVLSAADYPIVDLFSGERRGWLKCSIAAGSQEQVDRLKEELELKDVPTNVVAAAKSTRVAQEFVAATPPPPLNLEGSAGDRAPASSATVASSATPKSTHTRVQVSIIRACGLESAIAHLDPIGRREFAAELQLLPRRLFPSETLVHFRTPFVSGSSAPSFETTEILQLSSINTRLIMWMQNGGTAQGSILYRNHEGAALTVAKFEVPLKQLLLREVGVSRQWVPLYAGEHRNNKVGAIEVSLKLVDGVQGGFLDAEVSPLTNPSTARLHPKALCRLQVKIKPSYEDLRPDRWRLSGNLAAESAWKEVPAHSPRDFSLQWEISDMLAHTLKNSHMEIQLVQNGDYVGSIFVEMESFGGVLQEWLKRGDRQTTVESKRHQLQGNFDLVDPTAEIHRSLACGVSLELEIVPGAEENSKDSRKAGPRKQSFPVIDANDMSESSGPRNVHSIPIHITIERALHLPKMLTNDETATKPDGHQMRPPSTFVTFSWNTTGSKRLQEYFTPVCMNDTCPQWEHRVCVEQSADEWNLKQLKSKSLVLSVWHALTETADTAELRNIPRKLVGQAAVDLTPLFHGFPVLRGWYQILNTTQRPVGEIKVEIQPFESLFVPRKAEDVAPQPLRMSMDARMIKHVNAEGAFASSVGGQFISNPAELREGRVSVAETDFTASTETDDLETSQLRDKLRQSIIGLEEVHVKLKERLRMRSPNRQRPVTRHESDGQFFASSATEQQAEKQTIFFGGQSSDGGQHHTVEREDVDGQGEEEDETVLREQQADKLTGGEARLMLEDLEIPRALSPENQAFLSPIHTELLDSVVPTPATTSQENVFEENQEGGVGISMDSVPETVSGTASQETVYHITDAVELSRTRQASAIGEHLNVSDDEGVAEEDESERGLDARPSRMMTSADLKDLLSQSHGFAGAEEFSVDTSSSSVDSVDRTNSKSSTSTVNLNNMTRASSKQSLLLSPIEIHGGAAVTNGSGLPITLSKDEAARITRIFNSRPLIPPIQRSESLIDVLQERALHIPFSHTLLQRSNSAPTMDVDGSYDPGKEGGESVRVLGATETGRDVET